MRHRTTLELFYESATTACRVKRALDPEVGDIADDRSETSVSQSGEMLELTVKATDLTALRAGLNTWLSLVRVAEQSSAVNRHSSS